MRVYNGAHYEDPIAHCPPVAQQCHSNKSGPVGSPSRTISPDAFRCVGREEGLCGHGGVSPPPTDPIRHRIR